MLVSQQPHNLHNVFTLVPPTLTRVTSKTVVKLVARDTSLVANDPIAGVYHPAFPKQSETAGCPLELIEDYFFP